MELNVLLAQRLKAARLNKGFTQGYLAEVSGVHEKAIAKYERGVGLPSVDTLVKLAQALEVSTDFFLFEYAKMDGVPKINDPELYEKYFVMESLNESDRSAVKMILDSLVARQRLKELAASS